jgi:hypothetical protein
MTVIQVLQQVVILYLNKLSSRHDNKQSQIKSCKRVFIKTETTTTTTLSLGTGITVNGSKPYGTARPTELQAALRPADHSVEIRADSFSYIVQQPSSSTSSLSSRAGALATVLVSVLVLVLVAVLVLVVALVLVPVLVLVLVGLLVLVLVRRLVLVLVAVLVLVLVDVLMLVLVGVLVLVVQDAEKEIRANQPCQQSM